MNKLIIIGNGFDLAHGLNTRYSDFLVWYFNQIFAEHRSSGKYTDTLVGFNYEYQYQQSFTDLGSFTKFIGEFTKPIIKYNSNYFGDLVINYSNSNWVDIESDYYSRLLKIYKEHETNNQNHWDITISAVIGLNKVFSTIQQRLVEYLQTVQIPPSKYHRAVASHLEKIIYDPDIELTENNKDDSILILNFNYTSSLRLYSQDLKTDLLKETIYIHGSLNNSNNPIIFGYGDEMDPYYEKIENLNNNEFLKNIKSFSYFKTDNYQRFLRFVDSSQYKVYILGHSCGISDRILLNNIFEHENCQAIKIYYHQRGKNDTDFFEKTQEISRHFRPLKKSLMRKLIVPFPECSPLTPYDPNK